MLLIGIHLSGFDVADWHTSQTCNNRKPSHNEAYNRANAQEFLNRGDTGVCTAGIYKTQLPQVGQRFCQGGAGESANKFNDLVSATVFSSYPTQIMCHAVNLADEDDDRTIVTSNCSNVVPVTSPRPHPLTAAAHHLFGMPSHNALNAITIHSKQAIADTGATSIFIMDGVDVDNKRIATHPITINLPDGNRVKSTHVCDFIIPGLPQPLLGHIVPGLAVASLVGIRPLCKAGCKVTFDSEKCEVIYNDDVILTGYKDPSTDFWTLPIKTSKMWADGHRTETVLSNFTMEPSHQPRTTTRGDKVHQGVNLAAFSHSIRTRGNGVKFAHQLLCNPKISTLLKAVLRGCPNMTEKLILKYLNPSPATAKGHMKRQRYQKYTTIRTTECHPSSRYPGDPPTRCYTRRTHAKQCSGCCNPCTRRFCSARRQAPQCYRR
jgi:hypothetical protein